MFEVLTVKTLVVQDVLLTIPSVLDHSGPSSGAMCHCSLKTFKRLNLYFVLFQLSLAYCQFCTVYTSVPGQFL